MSYILEAKAKLHNLRYKFRCLKNAPHLRNGVQPKPSVSLLGFFAIQKKSEPDSDWIWVRILRLYAGYFLLTSNCLSPGGAVWFFPAFLFIRVLAFPVFTRYDVGNQITRRKTIMEYIKSSLSAGCFYGICTWNQMFEI